MVAVRGECRVRQPVMCVYKAGTRAGDGRCKKVRSGSQTYLRRSEHSFVKEHYWLLDNLLTNSQ
jgi:hypothetical protein